MKPRDYISGLLVILAITLVMPSSTFAHPGHRPHWVDAQCCDAGTRYIFFPDHNFYYDLEREVYIYPSGGIWVFSHSVPSMFVGLNLAVLPIMELDIHIDRPFLHNHDHIVWYRSHRHHHYVRYYEGHRYYREHPDYYSHGHKHNHGNHSGNYKNSHDNGNHYGHKKGGNGNDKNYGHRNSNGNHRGDGYGNRGNGGGSHGGYKKYEKKSNNEYVKRTNDHRSSGSGNNRNGDGRRSNGRGR